MDFAIVDKKLFEAWSWLREMQKQERRAFDSNGVFDRNGFLPRAPQYAIYSINAEVVRAIKKSKIGNRLGSASLRRRRGIFISTCKVAAIRRSMRGGLSVMKKQRC